MIYRRHIRRFAHLLVALALAQGPAAMAAVLVQEDFSVDPNWLTRDGEMGVAWSGIVGNPEGSIRGSFAEQDFPSPEIDAFRVDNTVAGGPWTGDYGSLYSGFTQFTFDFLAEDYLPSSLVLQISDGLNTFIRNLLPQVSMVGSFVSVTVPLSYDGSWLGGSAAQFASVMGNVTYIDFQVARSSTAAQDYFIDNLILSNDDNTPDPPLSAVPEATMVQLMVITLILLYSLHRRLRRATRSPGDREVRLDIR